MARLEKALPTLHDVEVCGMMALFAFVRPSDSTPSPVVALVMIPKMAHSCGNGIGSRPDIAAAADRPKVRLI
jgi:hypothetical protein